MVHSDLFGKRLGKCGPYCAISKGIEYVLAHPEESFILFTKVFPGAFELNRQSFEVIWFLYVKGVRHDDQPRWEAMQDFLLRTGMITKTFPLEELSQSCPCWLGLFRLVF